MVTELIDIHLKAIWQMITEPKASSVVGKVNIFSQKETGQLKLMNSAQNSQIRREKKSEYPKRNVGKEIPRKIMNDRKRDIATSGKQVQ